MMGNPLLMTIVSLIVIYVAFKVGRWGRTKAEVLANDESRANEIVSNAILLQVTIPLLDSDEVLSAFIIVSDMNQFEYRLREVMMECLDEDIVNKLDVHNASYIRLQQKFYRM